MNRTLVLALVAMLSVLTHSTDVWSQEPAPPPAPAPAQPATLWSFLGIEQAAEKCKLHVAVHKEKKDEKAALKAMCGDQGCLKRRFGSLCPCLCAACKKEKKPPVKPLTDPANLESANPAIKAAAEIKADVDLAPQKVKAIRYLSTIACGCYPQVKPALLAALDDCTEEVRYEAALALSRTAGCPCTVCNSSTCCDPAVRKKLQDLAYGTDEQGCLKEGSPRVRQAAAQAFDLCEMVAPLEETPLEEEPRELPVLPPNDAPGLPPEAESVLSDAERPAPVNLADPLPAFATGYSGGHSPYPGPPAENGTIKELPLAPAPGEGAMGVIPMEGAPPDEDFAAPEPMDLAGTFGAAPGPQSASPFMIGDFFGNSGAYLSPSFGPNPGSNISVGTAGGDRLRKIVEGNSPIPTDRVFFNYHFFNDPLVNIDGRSVDLNRYTFGIEKTFLGDMNSIELRVPFTSGYSSDQSLVSGSDLASAEFGDLSLVAKRTLFRRDCLLVSAGLGMVFPTGPDWRAFDEPDNGGLRVVVDNEAFHLQPFLGAAWQPNDRLFTLFFTQADFDANGNTVSMSDGVPSNRGPTLPQPVGVLQEQNLLFVDLNIGYWVYKSPCKRLLTGIAPVIELHYSTTMQSPDAVVGPAGTLGMNPDLGVGFGRRDVVNLTGGMYFQLGSLSTLSVAGVVPVRQGGDRDFDSELAIQFNRRF